MTSLPAVFEAASSTRCRIDCSSHCPERSFLMLTFSKGGKLSRIGPQSSGSQVKYPHTNAVVAPPPPRRIGDRSRVATFCRSARLSIGFDPEPALRRCGSPRGNTTMSPGDSSTSGSPSRHTLADPSTTK